MEIVEDNEWERVSESKGRKELKFNSPHTCLEIVTSLGFLNAGYFSQASSLYVWSPRRKVEEGELLNG
jgi:hypothetical protein